MVQLMPLHPQTQSSCASFKSRLVLHFWYRLTRVVLEKKPSSGCSSCSSAITFSIMMLLVGCLYEHRAYKSLVICWCGCLSGVRCRCNAIPSSLASLKLRIAFPFWVLLIQLILRFVILVTDTQRVKCCVIHTHTHTRLTAPCPGLPG